MRPSILRYNANTYIHSTVYEHSTTSSLFPFSGGDSLCIVYVRMYLIIGVLSRMYVLYMLYVLHVLYLLYVCAVYVVCTLCAVYAVCTLCAVYAVCTLCAVYAVYAVCTACAVYAVCSVLLYVCSSPVDCAVLISAQDDVLKSIDTAIQRIYDEAAANNGMMNEQQRKMLAYVVYCVCFVV